jgi:hypothetical protein
MALIHNGIQTTLVAIDTADIANGDTATIYLNSRTRLFTFDTSSSEATKIIRPGPYYLRPHDYSVGVWVESIGNDYDVMNADQIIGKKLTSTNWSTVLGSEYDLDAGTIKLGGSSAPAFSVTAAGVMTATGVNITGNITGGNLVISNTGAIYSTGKTSYADTDAGFFLGYDTDAHKFNMGDEFSFFKWNGDYVDAQFRNITFLLEDAPAAPTCTEDIAGNLNGLYYYRITLVTATGETSGGVVASITVTNKKVALSNIPTGTEKCIARKIYRSVGGGAVYDCRLVATISDNTTTTYLDNIADGSLGAQVPFYNSTGAVMFLNEDKIFSAGVNDTVVGLYAGSGVLCSFYGTNSGKVNTIGIANTYTGASSGGANISGNYGSFYGIGSGGANNTGEGNSHYGSYSGLDITSGSNDCTFGYYAGAMQNNGSAGLQTPENSVYIGAYTKSGSDPAGGEDVIDNEIVFGYNAIGNGSDTVTLGNTSIGELHCQVALTVDSDERIKRDITPLTPCLDFINALTPVTYKHKNPVDWPDEIKPCNFKDRTITEKDHKGKEKTRVIKADKRPSDNETVRVGLLAHDVERLAILHGIKGSFGTTSNRGLKGNTYEALIMPLISAVQELSQKMDNIELQI